MAGIDTDFLTCSWSLRSGGRPGARQHKVYPMVGTRSRAIRRGTFRRVFATCGTVGTGRSRAIRDSTSDDRVGCSASDGRYALRRVRRCTALHVSTRLSPFLPCALASADCIRPFPLLRLLVNVLRRTRRKPSTIRGAAPDVVIGQSTAAPAGARPYRRRRSGSVLSLQQCILTI